MVTVHGRVGSACKINTIPFDTMVIAQEFYSFYTTLFVYKMMDDKGGSFISPHMKDKAYWGVDDPSLYYSYLHGVVSCNATRKSQAFRISCLKKSTYDEDSLHAFFLANCSIEGAKVDSVLITGIRSL